MTDPKPQLTEEQLNKIKEELNKPVTYSIFGSSEDFLKDNVTEVWGNSGYTVNNVEKNSFMKNFRDIVIATSNIKGELALLKALATFDFKGIGKAFKKFWSGGKTTRYFYNYVQNVSPINGGYIPDLVQTYAMQGITQGNNPTESVQQQLKTGRGLKLKQFYHYSKRRYKNRQWNWETYLTSDFKGSSNVFYYDKFLATLPTGKRYRRMFTTRNFILEGQFYLDKLQREYGIDTLNAHAEPIDKTLPKDKSVGVTLWVGEDKPTEVLTRQLNSVVLDSKPNKVSHLVQEGQSDTFTILIQKDNPFTTPDTDSKNEYETEVPISNEEVITTVKVTLTRIEKIETIIPKRGLQIERKITTYKYYYDLEETLTTYEYTEEKHYYLTQSGLTNYEGFNKFWEINKEVSKTKNKITNKEEPSLHKLYAPIPIKDWFAGKDTWTQILFKESTAKAMSDAISDLNKLQEESRTKTEEEMSDSSVKGKRTENKVNRKNVKNEDETKSTRQLQRKITRGIQQDRKLKFNQDKLWDIKDYSPKTLKRHIEKLSELVGINYMQYVAGLMSQEHWNGGYQNYNTYQTSIYLGAIFANQTKESLEYWYHWAKRQYQLEGKEQSYNDWVSMVQSADDPRTLPLRVVKYKTTDKTHWGGYSYAFIRKIILEGRVRKIKRKHRLYDILRGKPVTVSSLAQLQQLIEPKQEIADDGWFYNEKSGKEYPIGGETFAGSPYTESNDPDIGQVFRNYSYTLFCKNTGNGKITCYAIAGLQFHTKMSERSFWCTAWGDLGNEFERHKQKYVDKKKTSDINVTYEAETGSRKHRHINKMTYFGIVPLDYNIVRRMNAVSLENFSQRAVLNYSWLFVEQKKKRGGMKYVKPVVTVVGFILAVVLSMYGQTWSWVVFAKALAIAAAVSIAVNLAVKHLILPLLKALGLKGIVALIIMVVIIIVAMMLGAPPDASALPYASEAVAKTATSVGNEVAQETIKQTLQQTIQTTLKDIAVQTGQQLVGTNLAQMAGNVIKYSAQAYNELQQEQVQNFQKLTEQDKDDFSRAIDELNEQQEELQSRQASYDVQSVLAQFAKNRVQVIEPDLYFINATAQENGLVTYEYLSAFLEQKLSIDPMTFDPIKSLDFSFKS